MVRSECTDVGKLASILTPDGAIYIHTPMVFLLGQGLLAGFRMVFAVSSRWIDQQRL